MVATVRQDDGVRVEKGSSSNDSTFPAPILAVHKGIVGQYTCIGMCYYDLFVTKRSGGRFKCI